MTLKSHETDADGRSPAGVFPGLGAAFIDCVHLELNDLNPHPWRGLPKRSNKPSSAIICLRSERFPLTVREMSRAAACLSARPPFLEHIEIAWDLRGSLEEIISGIVSLATRYRTDISSETGSSFVFGSNEAGRRVWAYEEAPGVVRIKILLGSVALMQLGITRPEYVPRLRSVDFRQVLSMCKLRVPKALVPERWRRKAWRHLAAHESLETVAQELSDCYSVPRSELLRPTALDGCIREMQRNLVY